MRRNPFPGDAPARVDEERAEPRSCPGSVPFTAAGDRPPDAVEWNSGPAKCPAGSEDTAAAVAEAWRAGRGRRRRESDGLGCLPHPPRTCCQGEAVEVQSRVDSERGRHRVLRDATSRDPKNSDLLCDGLRVGQGFPRAGAASAAVVSSQDGGPKKTARPTASLLDRRISALTQEIPPDPHTRRAAPQIPVGHVKSGPPERNTSNFWPLLTSPSAGQVSGQARYRTPSALTVTVLRSATGPDGFA